MQRYFCKERKENEFILEESDYFHIEKVMRMKEKDQIEVVYNKDVYLCELNNFHVFQLEKLDKKEQIEPEISLIIPLLKEQKMDYILQKATELGVTRIIPTVMERSIIKVTEEKEEKKLIRWTKICKEASEQSMRTQIPIITKIHHFQDFQNLEGVKFICSTREKENNIKKLLTKHKNCDKMYIVVGPEGGLSEKEEANLVKMGFVPVSLGTRILRVETVPLFLLSIINYQNME